MNRFPLLIVSILSFGPVAPSALSEEFRDWIRFDDPNLARVMKNYYQLNFGDVSNWEKLESLRFKGTLHMKGHSFKFVALKKKPNYMKVVMSGKSGGEIIFAYDGEHAWQFDATPNSNAVPMLMKEGETLNFIRDAWVGGHLVNPSSPGKRIELLGLVSFRNHRCYKLKVTLPDGQIIHSFLNITSFAEQYRITTNNQNQTEELTEFSDFRLIDGIRVPFSSSLFVDGKQIYVSNYDKVEINTGVMPWMFLPPTKDYFDVDPNSVDLEVGDTKGKEKKE